MTHRLKPGPRADALLVVGTNDTAPRIGSGRIGVIRGWRSLSEPGR